MILTLIILYLLTLFCIIGFLYWKARELTKVERVNVSTGPHHERWLYMLVHTLWRRGIRAFRRLIHEWTVTLIKTWILIVNKVNQWLRKRFPHLSYLFGERILAKHPSEVEASEFIKVIKAHQEIVREEAVTEKKFEPIVETAPAVVRKPRRKIVKTPPSIPPVSPEMINNGTIE